MHEIEPYFQWRHLYMAEEDPRSIFFGRTYSEFEFSTTIYNYYIHPQWDHFGSNTLYIKILFADYQEGFAIIEMMGEWNDALYNDIMQLKREVLEILMQENINKFILIGENVLNFHASDDSYYEEWFQEVEEGWIAMLNFRNHVVDEFRRERIDYYLNFGGQLDEVAWRTLGPRPLFALIDGVLGRRLS